MQSKWPKRLLLAAIVLSGLGVAGLVGMDMMLEAPPIDRVDLERLAINEPNRVSAMAAQDLDTVCVLLPYEKRVPEGERDAGLINDFLKTRTYAGDETHWSLALRRGERFAIARFGRSGALNIADGNSLAPGSLPTGFAPARCAAGDTAALVKLGTENEAVIVFGRAE